MREKGGGDYDVPLYGMLRKNAKGNFTTLKNHAIVLLVANFLPYSRKFRNALITPNRTRQL